MSANARRQQAFDSHLQFYSAVYGHALRETRTAGRCGVTLLLSEQEAGDWSDAPTPDLVVAVNPTGGPTTRASIDLGAGRSDKHFRPHDYIVIAPHAGSSIEACAPHRVLGMAVPYASLHRFAEESLPLPIDGDFGALHAGPNSSHELTALLERMWLESAAGSPEGSLWADGALLQLAALLLRGSRTVAEPSTGGLAPWQVRRVCEYIDAHLAEDVALADLAALLGRSPYHLCRAFKQSTGLPPHRWRLVLRVERARQLLEATDRPISDIAATVGYDDPSQFAAVFRKALGISPSRYRRERRP